MSTEGRREVEVKIPLSDPVTAHQHVSALGFTVSVPRVFEANTVYDTPGFKFRNSEVLLRLRQVGPKVVLTWKGPAVPGPHKNRPELETTVGSFEMLDLILRALDFQPAFRYEKYRTEFANPKSSAVGTVTIDETPIGNFFELEGPADWIDETARRLGFSPADYVLLSYSKLYLEHCARIGVEPANMVFASHDNDPSDSRSFDSPPVK